MKENTGKLENFYNNIEKFEFNAKEQIAVFENKETQEKALNGAKENFPKLVEKIENGIIYINEIIAIYTFTLEEISALTRNDVWGYDKVESVTLYKIDDCQAVEDCDRSKDFIAKIPSEFDYFASQVNYVNKKVNILLVVCQEIKKGSACPDKGAMTYSINLKSRNGKSKIVLLSYPVEV